MPLLSKSLRTPSRMRFSDGDMKEVSSGCSMRLLPSSSWRFLDRFWVVGIGQWHGESKSTGTSGSSQSKFSSSSSRKPRSFKFNYAGLRRMMSDGYACKWGALVWRWFGCHL
ncbi:hypothetical protein Hdeb2414_s0004g00132241 [Helianthus debilis subsp. tardiflorus]